jgi:hypothetical protein
LTLGRLASEFRRELAVKQGCNLSPAYAGAGRSSFAT